MREITKRGNIATVNACGETGSSKRGADSGLQCHSVTVCVCVCVCVGGGGCTTGGGREHCVERAVAVLSDRCTLTLHGADDAQESHNDGEGGERDVAVQLGFCLKEEEG